MICIAVSEPIALLAMHLYWSIFLLFAPFAVSSLLYPYLRQGYKFLFFLAFLGLLICLKSLCGYEYLSSILLSAMVPILYYEIRSGSSSGRIIRLCATVALTEVLAFGIALILHAEQAARYCGSWDQGMKEILEVIRYRTVGAAPNSQSGIFTDLCKFLSYFFNMQQAYYFILAVASLLYLRAAKASDAETIRGYSRYSLAFIVVIAAFFASQSWNILAWGHMRDHLHLNYMTYYLPFNLIVIALSGYCYSLVLSENRSSNIP
jgi:hypothetical protein